MATKFIKTAVICKGLSVGLLTWKDIFRFKESFNNSLSQSVTVTHWRNAASWSLTLFFIALAALPVSNDCHVIAPKVRMAAIASIPSGHVKNLCHPIGLSVAFWLFCSECSPSDGGLILTEEIG